MPLLPNATLRGREAEERVTALELFFDLVFVLAITQVTSLIAAEKSWTSLAEGLAVLTLLWWAWAGYTWLGNTINPEEGGVRIVMFAVMTAFLVVALAVPGAFDHTAATFAIAYLAVRILHLVLYGVASRDDPDMRRAVARLAVSSLIGPPLIVVAAFTTRPATATLWIVAIAIDLGGPIVSGTGGWRVVAPSHFAERHGLIVIIALGESIVALGVGAAGLDITPGLLGAAVAGMAVICALWWNYFDILAIVGERRIREATGVQQTRMARDSYSYLHLPLVSGIVLFAVGLKSVIADPSERLDAIPAVCMTTGVGLYLWGLSIIRLRNVGGLNVQRSVAGTVAVALVAVALTAPALAALASLAGLMWVLVAYEVRRFGSVRERVRHLGEGATALVPDDPAPSD